MEHSDVAVVEQFRLRMANGIKIDQEPVLSVKKRFDLVQRLQTGAPIGRIAGEFDIHPCTARRIRRNALTICQPAEQKNIMWMRENTRKLSEEDIDVQLYSWFMKQNAIGTSVTDSSLREKAMELGEPTVSRGWLTNFKERHHVKLSEPAGISNFHTEVLVKEELCLKEEVLLDETAMAEPDESSINEVSTEKFLKNLTERFLQEGISNKNIYYMKDTTLVWKAFPTTLLEQCKSRNGRHRQFKRDRVTVALCCNVSGCHKLELLFIYDNENPKVFKHCRDRLPVLFKGQSQARMDQTTFLDWFENHFKPTVNILQFPDRGKIVLILDDEQRRNFEIPTDFTQTEDVQIVFFSAEASHLLQPLKHEVAEKTKRSYRLKMLSSVFKFPDGVRKFYFDYDLKDCIDLFAQAWAEVSMASVRAAWNKIVDTMTEIHPIKEEQVDPLEPNLQDIIGVISGEREPNETTDEFLLRCEEAEKNIRRDGVRVEGNGDEDHEDDEDENENDSDDESKVPTEDVMKKAFKTLLRWSKQQPQYIQLQVEYLKNYYESTISVRTGDNSRETQMRLGQ